MPVCTLNLLENALILMTFLGCVTVFHSRVKVKIIFCLTIHTAR